MKKIIALIFLFHLAGCYNDNAEAEITQITTPTLDSNTVGAVVDSNSTIQYLDNPHSDTFSIAMDSVGATVTAEDTSLRR